MIDVKKSMTELLVWFNDLLNDWVSELLEWITDHELIPINANIVGISTVAGFQHSELIAVSYAIIFVVGGLLIMSHETVSTRFTVKTVLPRLIIGFILSGMSAYILTKFIDTSRSVVGAFLGIDLSGGAVGSSGNFIEGLTSGEYDPESLMQILITVIQLIALLSLIVASYIRNVAIFILGIVAVPALACHGLQVTEQFAHKWWKLVAACVASSIGQSAVVWIWIKSKKFFSGDPVETDNADVSYEFDIPFVSASLFFALVMAWMTWRVHKAAFALAGGGGGGRGIFGGLMAAAAMRKGWGTVSKGTGKLAKTAFKGVGQDARVGGKFLRAGVGKLGEMNLKRRKIARDVAKAQEPDNKTKVGQLIGEVKALDEKRRKPRSPVATDSKKVPSPDRNDAIDTAGSDQKFTDLYDALPGIGTTDLSATARPNIAPSDKTNGKSDTTPKPGATTKKATDAGKKPSKKSAATPKKPAPRPAVSGLSQNKSPAEVQRRQDTKSRVENTPSATDPKLAPPIRPVDITHRTDRPAPTPTSTERRPEPNRIDLPPAKAGESAPSKVKPPTKKPTKPPIKPSDMKKRGTENE